MAHMIDESTGIAAIAYVGNKPWHGLGQELTLGASIEEWTKQAGLAWSVNRAPVQYQNEALGIIEMPERHVLYRNDTNKALSVVSDRYKEVQPSQIMDFFRELTEKSGAQMETAGSLRDGKTIWALARMDTDSLIMDDAVAPYLMLSTSYDYMTPTLAKMTSVRVVCNNTIQMALNEEGKKQIRIPHSTTFRADDIRAGLDISLNEFERFKQQATKLAQQAFSLSDMDQYLIKLFQPEVGEIDGDKIRKSKHYAQIIDLFNGAQLGGNHDAVKGTAWGALNAVTEYTDWHKGKDQSARLQDAWLGMGAQLKVKALELLAA